MQKKAPALASPVASFVALVRFKLPVPGPSGDELFVVLKPVTFDDMLEITQRLPAAIPGQLEKRRRELVEAKEQIARREDMTPEELTHEFEALKEQIADAHHDAKLVQPMIDRLVRLGVDSPRFTFEGEPETSDAVPWRLLDPRNQAAIFGAIMSRYGYQGGAIEKVESFRDGKPKRAHGGRRSVRPRAARKA